MRLVLTILSLLVCTVAGCQDPALELTLDIREASDRKLFTSVELLHLRAERDTRALVEQTFPPTASSVSISGVSYGARTIFSLEGTSATGDVVARGSTCPLDFHAPSTGGAARASLFFAPTNSFAPTASPPASVRTQPVALAVPSGDILVAGGGADGTIATSAERFRVATSAFTSDDAALARGRQNAESVDVAGIGALVTGGYATDGSGIATAEVYRYDTGLFTTIENAALGARAGHRAVLLPSEAVLLTGGAATHGGVPLATTATVRLQPDGTATASVGPNMVRARRDHSAVVASGVPVLIGGYGVDGAPLASIEALVPSASAGAAAFAEIAALRTARAETTASLLEDGTILIVGGAGDAQGAPLLDAEVYNPITNQTTVYPLAAARRGHSATTLPDGRVLIVGGIGSDGAPLTSVELFIPGIGFVSERPLGTPRAGHRAIPLCDGTVLVVGGGSGGELYTPPK